jgi:hypothetical protein
VTAVGPLSSRAEGGRAIWQTNGWRSLGEETEVLVKLIAVGVLSVGVIVLWASFAPSSQGGHARRFGRGM